MRIEDRTTSSRAARAYGRTAAGPGASSSVGAHSLDRPVATMLGIPDSELTPNVVGAIERLLGEVRQLHDEIETMRERLRSAEALADSDPLVPLRNRRAFVRELERMIAYTERHETPMTLIMLDVDGLKPINDRGGHACGDEAIRQVASALIEETRASDLLGRLGGDEFGVVLMDMDRLGADMIAARIQEAIAARSVMLPEGPVALSASCGVCEIRPGLSLSEAMAAADARMYDSKARHRVMM